MCVLRKLTNCSAHPTHLVYVIDILPLVWALLGRKWDRGLGKDPQSFRVFKL